MGFRIAVADVEAAVQKDMGAANQWAEAAGAVESALGRLMGLPGMQGAAADAIRARVSECLVPIARAARDVSYEYSRQIVLYLDAVHSVEPDGSGVLPEDEMGELEDVLHGYWLETTANADDVTAAARTVSDLVSLPGLHDGRLLGAYQEAEREARRTRNDTGELEARMGGQFSRVADLVDALEAFVGRVSGATAGGFSPGSVAASPEYAALCRQIVASEDRMRASDAAFRAAYKRENERRRRLLAEQREREGGEQFWKGVFYAAMGVGAIVLTGGAAVPVVCGTAAAIYGLSEMGEGQENVRLGRLGDIDTRSGNVIRDMVFGGNQELDDLVGGAAVALSGLSIGGMAAVKAAGLGGAGFLRQLPVFGKAVAVGLAQDRVADAAGKGAGGLASLFMDEDDARKVGAGVGLAVGLLSPEGAGRGLSRLVGKTDDVARIASRADDFADDMDDLARLAAGGDDVARGLDGLTDVERAAAAQRMQESVTEFERRGREAFTTVQRGNYGEIRAHQHLVDAGWQRVGRNPPADVYAKGHQGIDGIYYKAGEKPPWLVVEAKYGKGRLSVLKNGVKQMSDRWINDRLGHAIESGGLVDRISSDGYQKVLIRINHDGSLTSRAL